MHIYIYVNTCPHRPHGTRIYNTLVKFIRDEYWKRGYDEVRVCMV
jgi:threonyl-tRNA synthetase